MATQKCTGLCIHPAAAVARTYYPTGPGSLLVDDHQRLAEFLLQVGGKGAGEAVVVPAGRKRHDDVDGPLGIVLCVKDGRLAEADVLRRVKLLSRPMMVLRDAGARLPRAAMTSFVWFDDSYVLPVRAWTLGRRR